MTILIVEDQARERRLLRDFIEVAAMKRHVSVEVLEAADFPQAFNQVHGADLVLCDAHFPLRADPKYNLMPWLYVHGMCQQAILLGIKRFALLTGDDTAAETARCLYGLEVFRKPLEADLVMDWVFARIERR